MAGIYDDVIMSGEMRRVEMMVDIYESADCVRVHDFSTDTNTQQPLRKSGSECVRNRSYRAATVCLALLCVLLLTAVIVLCVLTNTNNHQLHNLTEEREQLLTNNTNLTEERNQLLTNNTNLTEERDQLLTNNTNLTEEREQLLTNNNHLTEEREQLLTKTTNLTDERDQLLIKLKKFQKALGEVDGWTVIYYNFSFYLISSEGKNWNESRRYCRERGADLLIINNREEQDFVQKISGSELTWIGLSDSDKEGSWKWVDNSTLNSGESFWRSGEPGGKTNENCVLSHSSEWHDYPCTYVSKWICEKNI